MKLLVLLLFILKLYVRINVFKNKVIMEATISYIKILKDSLVPYLNNDLLLNDFHLKPIIRPLSYYDFSF